AHAAIAVKSAVPQNVLRSEDGRVDMSSSPFYREIWCGDYWRSAIFDIRMKTFVLQKAGDAI
ncbi:MAG: hypothetical protein RSE06_03380, partial [Comamonas sp.]